MARSGFQLSGDAARIYEEQKVPTMFAPLAVATLDQVTVLADDVVLDIACGTGIVARTVRQRAGAKPRIVGTDLNGDMIAIAQSLTDDAARTCEWQTADATDLPFEADTFSIAFCQQGIQFFPDKQAALTEVHRVLKPAGRICFTVWNGVADIVVPMTEALAQHVSADAARKATAPFALEANQLLPMLAEAGFMECSISDISINRTIPATVHGVRGEIEGLPIAKIIFEKSEAAMDHVVQDTFTGLAPFRQGDFFVVPQKTHLIEAVKGS
ncbi:MAG: methyltransferase domain-containing protein [Alphaproteobacteria bacterium]|jgi:ubiquinone/menaquinone biosynthesis C-methylase UbiE|nr:methyltransferase domain-containing protein [Alphaproteobacteria bacterium]MBT4018501.1 methyltransferase domain-containing protein [Alphaproteobacteria bacterium]MBT5162165.1 methyltransferase domain-containing protein [Alphaproteobacteria bacterium]MBT5917876.1 methyltransferase domain-containing protein [Alphaproteobacteria bacterium]MBT7746058.1 methyltransferase domain-containing protein [Alphaproteobacteria bacterium]